MQPVQKSPPDLPTEVPQGGVFISYRRDDDSQAVHRLAQKLRAAFGNDMVFLDVESTPLGESYPEYITKWIRAARVVLVVIGHKWHEAKDQEGQYRLMNPADFVRREIELAQTEKKRIIPVATQSNITWNLNIHIVPESLLFLHDLQALHLRPRADDFNRDVMMLIRALKKAGVSPGFFRRHRTGLIVLTVCIAVVSFISTKPGWWRPAELPKDGSSPPVSNQQGDGPKTPTTGPQPSVLLNTLSADDSVRLNGATEDTIVQIAAECQDKVIQELALEHRADPATLLRIIKERYLNK